MPRKLVGRPVRRTDDTAKLSGRYRGRIPVEASSPQVRASVFKSRCDIDPRLEERRPRMWRFEKMRGWIRARSIYAAGTRDERIADFEHIFETDRPIRRNGLAQRILGDDDLHSRRLTVIP